MNVFRQVLWYDELEKLKYSVHVLDFGLNFFLFSSFRFDSFPFGVSGLASVSSFTGEPLDDLFPGVLRSASS